MACCKNVELLVQLIQIERGRIVWTSIGIIQTLFEIIRQQVDWAGIPRILDSTFVIGLVDLIFGYDVRVIVLLMIPASTRKPTEESFCCIWILRCWADRVR